MHTHDGYAPHSHEVRADHLGVSRDSTDRIMLSLHARSVTSILGALSAAKKASRNPRNPDLPSGSDMTAEDWQDITDEIRAQLNSDEVTQVRGW